MHVVDHLYQLAQMGKLQINLNIGVLEIKGSITNPDVIKNVLQLTFRRTGRDPIPAFDSTVAFGIFPDGGFERFYGDDYRLVESELQE